uniref:Uncharacterized protein n=1 Tax=Arundo donax TaxID=35708 RepID=A0A0A9DGG7_ARUDO
MYGRDFLFAALPAGPSLASRLAKLDNNTNQITTYESITLCMQSLNNLG